MDMTAMAKIFIFYSFVNFNKSYKYHIFVFKKYYWVWKLFEKRWISKFFASIFKEKKIWNANFSTFLFQYPQNFVLEWFLTPKKKFTWRIDNLYFIIDKMVSVRKCFGHFVPPLSLIRVKDSRPWKLVDLER